MGPRDPRGGHPAGLNRHEATLVAICHLHCAMARSIRISDALYALATAEARLMDRSLAQQLEHWAKLGFALDRSGLSSLDDVRAAALRFRHATDAASVQAGQRSAASLHVIPKDMVRQFRMSFPAEAFEDDRDGW